MSKSSGYGKGDRRRLQSINNDDFEDNWDLAFKRSDKNAKKIRHKKKLRKPVDYE